MGAWQTTGADATVYDSSNLGPATTSTLGVAFLSNQSGRYEIIALPGSGGAQVVRFRLYDDLPLGGSAAAKIQIWDAGSSAYVDGADITVVDYYGALGRRGKWQGRSGYYGFAIKLPDKNEYQILDMERIALFVQVTLTENMGATTAQQAACAFVGGNNGWWQGQDTAAATFVSDPLSIYAHAQTGDRCIACWDDSSAVYKIVDGPTAQTVRWARAYADHTLAGSSNSNAHYVECQRVDDVTGAGYDGSSAHFNVLLPSPSSATDPNVQAGSVVGYTIDPDGNNVCVTGYLDDARGMIKIWSGAAASIPHGWKLCDGSTYGSFATPDLRGKFVLGAQPGGSTPFDDDGNSNDIGDTGGTIKHTHAAHDGYSTGYATLEVFTYESSPPSFSLSIDPITVTGYTEEGKETEPTFLTEVINLPPIDTVIDPFTATVDVSINTSSIYTFNVGATTCVPQVGPDEGDSCGAIEINDIPVNFDPDPPTATSTYSGGGTTTGNLDPNPHSHGIPALRLNADPIELNYEYAFTGGAYVSQLYPEEHNHTIPSLAHDQKYHVPPYYALCYIMRVQ